MSRLGRNYWLSVLALAYTCFEAARSGGGLAPWLAVVLLPLALAEVVRRTQQVPGDDRAASERRAGVRVCAWGVLLLVAARTGGAARPALDAAANLGTGAAAVGALLALARLPSPGGLLEPMRSARSLDATSFVGFLWSVATAVPAVYAVMPAPSVRFDPLIIDYATTSAGIGSLLVMVVATFRLRLLRRLELGVGDRTRSAFALCVATFTIAVPAAWLDVAPPDRVLPAAVAVASAASAWAATVREATFVTRLLRGLLATTILGAPLIVAATVIAEVERVHAPAVVLLSSIAAVAVGLIARTLARPLGPEQSRWLVALDRAARDALQPEPNAALRAALMTLRELGPTNELGPEIWQRDPSEVLRVDVAGYLHVARSEAPDTIYELGLREPERTLRTDALKALEVRRPDVRGALAWLNARGAYSATIVVDDDGPLGFIALPKAGRRSPLTLEEARAARLLADRVSSLLAVAAALSRSRERETTASARADAVDDECRRLEHIIHGESERYRTESERLARPARRGAYSGSARAALIELERMGQHSTLAALVTPPGVDPIAWAAHLHLASARSGGPFVVLDAATAEEQSAERWSDEKSSPLTLADGGTLLAVNLLALPLTTQENVAIALSRRAAHAPRSNILPPGVVIAVPKALNELTSDGALSANLARWFAGNEARLPALRERAEDLRALALDVLCRRCLALGKEPLGIDSFALRLLVEHDWPDNENELSFVLGRAARIAAGSVVTAKDLADAGFVPSVSAPDHTPLPAAPRRRATRTVRRRS